LPISSNGSKRTGDKKKAIQQNKFCNFFKLSIKWPQGAPHKSKDNNEKAFRVRLWKTKKSANMGYAAGHSFRQGGGAQSKICPHIKTTK
jgi:hypothetical protein